MHDTDVFSVQRLRDDWFVAFHDDFILHSKVISVREKRDDGRLQLALFSGPSTFAAVHPLLLT